MPTEGSPTPPGAMSAAPRAAHTPPDGCPASSGVFAAPPVTCAPELSGAWSAAGGQVRAGSTAYAALRQTVSRLWFTN